MSLPIGKGILANKMSKKDVKNFRRKILKNGLTVLYEKRDLPIVSIAFAVRYGGGYENEEEKGISHVIEHMIYKGTNKRTWQEISSEIEKKGGILNGFTGEDATAFWCCLPSKHFDIGINVLSDMVVNSLFDEKEFEKEKKVILEELRMYKDTPRSYVLDKIKEFLYKKPFAIPIIGTESSLGNLIRDKLYNKFQKLYSAENMILCVVGDVDFEKVCRTGEKIGKRKSFEKQEMKVIEREYGTKIETRKGIDQANLVFAFRVPNKNKERYTTEVLNALLAGWMSSRLVMEIREKRGLAYYILGGLEHGRDYSYYLITTGTNKENVKKVKELILKEFDKLKDLSEKEVIQVKEQLIGLRTLSKESSIGVMTELLREEINGNASEYYNYKERINAVNLADVKKLASSVKKHGYSFFALVPE